MMSATPSGLKPPWPVVRQPAGFMPLAVGTFYMVLLQLRENVTTHSCGQCLPSGHWSRLGGGNVILGVAHGMWTCISCYVGIVASSCRHVIHTNFDERAGSDGTPPSTANTASRSPIDCED